MAWKWKSDFEKIANKLNINKAISYPKLDIGAEYFVIEISGIECDKNLLSFTYFERIGGR